MRIEEVSPKKGQKDFLNVERLLNANDPNWVCPLDSDIKAVFDPAQNPFFTHGTAQRWVLYNAQNKPIGRVAAFINHKKAEHNNMPTGGMGFFQCIDNQQAANLLFEQCVQWLKAQGMQAMLGPINFGENDNYWGLLVEGFISPSYGMNYNPPYYQALFENFGFVKQYEQITNLLNLVEPLPERVSKIAQWVIKKPHIEMVQYQNHRFDQLVQDFMYIYNEAWQHNENFTPLKLEYVKKSFKQLRPVMDGSLICFAYVNKEPAGFLIAAPDVNQAFKYFNGKLNLWNKLRFLWLKRQKVMNRVRIIIMGVVPKFQKLGLESALTYSAFYTTAKTHKHKYVEAELSWVGDFNEQMIAVHKAVGAKPGKKHFTYKYEFE